jgi:hypothetical protein
MRDVNARDMNAGGDINIYDQSNQERSLSSCTVSELYEERHYRKALLSRERRAKLKRLALFWLIGALGIAGFALWQYSQGNENFAKFLFPVGQFLLALSTLKLFEQPTPFEQRQEEALQEIAMLLRERGTK